MPKVICTKQYLRISDICNPGNKWMADLGRIAILDRQEKSRTCILVVGYQNGKMAEVQLFKIGFRVGKD